MKLFFPKVELQVIHSVLKSTPDIRSLLLTSIRIDHFGFGPAQEVFKRINASLRSSSSDQLPSLEIFAQDPVLSDTAREFLLGTAIVVTERADAEALIEILEQFRQTRTMQRGISTITDHLKGDHVELPSAIQVLESTLLDVRSSVDQLEVYHAGVTDTLEEEVHKYLERPKAAFVPSGIDGFDTRASGFERGDLVVLGSHTSGGKTWLMTNMAINQYLHHNLNTFFVSLEMSKEEMLGRTLSNISGVSHSLIRKSQLLPTQKKDVYYAFKGFTEHGKLRKCRFSLYPSSRLTAQSLEALVKPLGYDCLLVDYLNLMQHSDEGTPLWQKLGEIIRDLKLLAKRLNVVIIIATQLDEEEHIRYSRMVKEHADFVWIWGCGEKEKAAGQVTVELDKARNMEQFKFACGIDFDKGVFGQAPMVEAEMKFQSQKPPPGMQEMYPDL